MRTMLVILTAAVIGLGAYSINMHGKMQVYNVLC